MSLLPDRHPNLDFFVLDIADAVPKDDMASMEHPLFSLATKPDMRHLEYRSGDNVLKIRPSGLGLPTIFGGAIITEQVFKVNGIGAALIGAIHANDLPMVQTLTFIFAVLIVLFNLIADILYGVLDPRIRYD